MGGDASARADDAAGLPGRAGNHRAPGRCASRRPGNGRAVRRRRGHDPYLAAAQRSDRAVPGAQLVLEVTSLPGDQGPAPGQEREGESTSSSSRATARAVTAGQAPRWRGSAASPSARDEATPTRPSSPVAPVRPAGSVPSWRSARRGARRRTAARPQAGCRGCRRPTRGRGSGRRQATHRGHRRQAVEHVPDRNRARLADGGEVDRRRPCEEQSDVAVDGRALAGSRSPSWASPAATAAS